VPKPQAIELADDTVIPILYEDRSVLAIDKPAGWLLAPDSWDQTGRNLQLALQSSIRAGDFWARSRGLKFLRFVHRLDAETSGVLLLVKHPDGVAAYSQIFAKRDVDKTYLVIVQGIPSPAEWVCRERIGPDPRTAGRMKVDRREGKEAETLFTTIQSKGEMALLKARPLTGRTHQIRVHLQASGYPVIGDPLYGGPGQQSKPRLQLALRATELAYRDPFTKRAVRIQAPIEEFLHSYGFS